MVKTKSSYIDTNSRRYIIDTDSTGSDSNIRSNCAGLDADLFYIETWGVGQIVKFNA